MNIVPKIPINQYNYDLPDEKIARFPLEKRDESKLLIYRNNKIEESIFKHINNFLPNNCQLIFNNTKVIHARLFFRKQTGANIEIFCLNPVKPADYQQSFEAKKEVVWECMVGNAKKWKAGRLEKCIDIDGKAVTIFAEQLEKKNASFTIKFSWDVDFSFSEVIEHAGMLPIPPYLNRKSEASDETTYQTVYAKMEGSVAAPTAGLHFTPPIIEQLHLKDIVTDEITLHVGAGTFRPVKTTLITDHEMHTEMVIIKKSTIEELMQPRKTIAVGTTSVRSLESLYWLGVLLGNKNNWNNQLSIEQWIPYQSNTNLTKEQSLSNVLDYLSANNLCTIRFATQIIIVPGYQFKIIDGMFTNFHQPKSTLLLLIAAFLADKWQEIYRYALENNFRFLSYGDSNLYLKN